MNLRTIREARGLTQKQLGEASGVDQSTVQRIEALSASVTLGKVFKVAEYLAITLPEIFADERSALETLLVRHWRSLPETEQARWAEHLRLAAGDPPGGGSPQADPPTASKGSV